jgi:glycosyltransferase involved in cell wall biosynthesis
MCYYLIPCRDTSLSNRNPVSKTLETPDISVILPTFNRRARLEKSLPALLGSTTSNVEFVIIDNCSTDDTWDYLCNIKSNDDRIRILKNPQNIGAVRSIFRGYCEALSPYVIFAADDDLIIGDYISQCLSIFETHYEVGIIHHFFDGWQRIPERYQSPFTIYPKGRAAIEKLFMYAGSYPGLALRMSAFNMRCFPLGDRSIYPQVKISIDVANKHSLAIVNDCGFTTLDNGDTIRDYRLVQNRPSDMGIGERLGYACDLNDHVVIHQLSHQLAAYAICILREFEKGEPEFTPNFVYSLSESLNTATPLFLILLVKSRKYKYALFSLLRLQISTTLLKNYFHALLYISSRVLFPFFARAIQNCSQLVPQK